LAVVVNDEGRQEIVDRYERGESCRTIAAAMYISATTAHDVLVSEGVQLRDRVSAVIAARSGPRSPDPERLERQLTYATARLYEVIGFSMDEVAEVFGCSAATVHGRLHRAGVPIRPRGPRHRA
jgi:predicted RNA polymerase sigma factor